MIRWQKNLISTSFSIYMERLVIAFSRFALYAINNDFSSVLLCHSSRREEYKRCFLNVIPFLSVLRVWQLQPRNNYLFNLCLRWFPVTYWVLISLRNYALTRRWWKSYVFLLRKSIWVISNNKMLQYQFVLIGVGPLLHRNHSSRRSIHMCLRLLYIFTQNYIQMKVIF